MKLASYRGTQLGIKGLGNWLIRKRLRGQYSHSEIVFEPGDDVDHLMPDGTTQPDSNGAYWCASSVATDRIPNWSPRRSGHFGGMRFKRVVVETGKWDLLPTGSDPLHAARWAFANQGLPYDWQLISGFINWLVPQKDGRVMCSEACAEMLGYPSAWRFDPCVLHAVTSRVAQVIRK